MDRDKPDGVKRKRDWRDSCATSRTPEGAPYSFNDIFDRKTGFVTKSMLALPFQDYNGKILGVLQLINSRDLLDKTAGRS